MAPATRLQLDVILSQNDYCMIMQFMRFQTQHNYRTRLLSADKRSTACEKEPHKTGKRAACGSRAADWPPLRYSIANAVVRGICKICETVCECPALLICLKCNINCAIGQKFSLKRNANCAISQKFSLKRNANNAIGQKFSLKRNANSAIGQKFSLKRSANCARSEKNFKAQQKFRKW